MSTSTPRGWLWGFTLAVGGPVRRTRETGSRPYWLDTAFGSAILYTQSPLTGRTGQGKKKKNGLAAVLLWNRVPSCSTQRYGVAGRRRYPTPGESRGMICVYKSIRRGRRNVSWFFASILRITARRLTQTRRGKKSGFVVRPDALAWSIRDTEQGRNRYRKTSGLGKKCAGTGKGRPASRDAAGAMAQSAGSLDSWEMGPSCLLEVPGTPLPSRNLLPRNHFN